MVVKKSCVAAYPVGWPDGRGISGRMRVEWVAGSTWNRWSDAHGMGGQMTVESAVHAATLLFGKARTAREAPHPGQVGAGKWRINSAGLHSLTSINWFETSTTPSSM